MTAEPVSAGSTSAGSSIECPSCEIDFDPVADGRQASYLAGVHNDLHHPGTADEARAQVVTAAELGWAVEPAVLADAVDQAVPFAGDTTASDRAWAARVDTAVQGMDVADPARLDTWIEGHAAADAPHLVEAELVAAWESHVRAYYADDVPAQTTQAVAASEPAGLVAEQGADEDGAWEL